MASLCQRMSSKFDFRSRLERMHSSLSVSIALACLSLLLQEEFRENLIVGKLGGHKKKRMTKKTQFPLLNTKSWNPLGSLKTRSLLLRILITGWDSSHLKQRKIWKALVFAQISEDHSSLLVWTHTTTHSLDGNFKPWMKQERLNLERGILFTLPLMVRHVLTMIDLKEKE